MAGGATRRGTTGTGAVIGLEEICSYFHLGHAASIADNPISRMGVPTAITLTPGRLARHSLCVRARSRAARLRRGRRYPTPRQAASILVDGAGREVFAACDLGFVTGP